ncbi:Zn-finger containing protein [Candidatus Nitrosotenuis uzonensis]|uniref:Zn-finger containing protein n=1 Tax=Candidatus Nitrosotenuis uzonensis TaxID=1407055 RepID=A0A812F2L8_9ARCH|nr:Zn-finger containing protein [Candidatus Nitrosotenuis uzonensis]
MGRAKAISQIKLFKKNICPMCTKSFRSLEEMMQHQQVLHGKDIPYECKKCNQSFSNMQDMRTHLQRFHSYKKDMS